jgi:hypothetical protein
LHANAIADPMDAWPGPATSDQQQGTIAMIVPPAGRLVQRDGGQEGDV